MRLKKRMLIVLAVLLALGMLPSIVLASADSQGAGANTQTAASVCSGPCVTGCTRTLGYWKTHPQAWPVNSLTLGTVSYSKAQLLKILNQPVRGNGLISLAHQLIAAKLNAATGASVPSDVAYTLWSQADALIGARVVPPVGNGYLAPDATSWWTSVLDQYNNGMAPGGPPHCN
jgi:hypothetical protein